MPVYGYWNQRGLGQSIRLLMAYTDDDAVEKTYMLNPDAKVLEDCCDEWFHKDKYALGLHFPNLPYYIDGDVKLTQSKAILRHIARKHNLAGDTEEERWRLDVLAEELTDFHYDMFALTYDPKFDENQAQCYKVAVDRLKWLEKFMGDKSYYTGDNIKWADFYAYEVVYQLRMLWPDIIKGYPKLTAFLQRFEALPKIKAFMASPKFIKRPCMRPIAANRVWGPDD